MRAGDLVFLSGQIPLNPETMELVDGGIEAQIARAFDDLTAVAEAAGGGPDRIVKFDVYLTDPGNFGAVNAEMEQRLGQPDPARAAVEVSALPKGTRVEVEAVMRATRWRPGDSTRESFVTHRGHPSVMPRAARGSVSTDTSVAPHAKNPATGWTGRNFHGIRDI